jgi:hypothetical protein
MKPASPLDSATRRSAAQDFNFAWGATLPLELDAPRAGAGPAPFREPIHGLVTREVDAPELFERFFATPG